MTCQDINPYDGTVLRSRNWPSVGTGGSHDDQHARNRRPVLGRRRARIERQLRRIAGVGRVSVNPDSGSATVVYEPAKSSLSE